MEAPAGVSNGWGVFCIAPPSPTHVWGKKRAGQGVIIITMQGAQLRRLAFSKQHQARRQARWHTTAEALTCRGADEKEYTVGFKTQEALGGSVGPPMPQHC